ncbi:MAG: DUF423 domain-containing protein [Alphaproteobacteria bacterium]|nr:DUF423 domain-containing protein [Alphaproteobacteria bacterium]
MNRLLVFGAVLGFISVIMGALGDHALDLSPEKTKGFDTAIRYNMLYAVLITAFALSQQKALILPGVIFAFSGALFSFSIYASVFTGISVLTYLTPIGGLGLMAGWISLFICALRTKDSRA